MEAGEEMGFPLSMVCTFVSYDLLDWSTRLFWMMMVIEYLQMVVVVQCLTEVLLLVDWSLMQEFVVE